MAPELLRGGTPYDPRAADMWACGIILFAVLTKSLPFTDETLHDPQFHLWQCDKVSFWHDLRLKVDHPPLSSAAVSVIEGLMDCDVSRRLTADAALRHPFCICT